MTLIPPLKFPRFTINVCWVSVCFGCSIFLSSSAHAFEVRIEMRDQVSLEKAQVTLSDLANISSDNLTSLRKVMAIPIGQAPRLGQEIFLERDVVERWAKRYLTLMGQTAKWEGASQTLVSTPSQEIGGEQIVEKAQAVLSQWLTTIGEKNGLQLVQLPRPFIAPKGEVSLVARALPKQAELRSRMAVTVDVHVAGKLFRSVAVSFDVSVFRLAWVARRELAIGETVDESALERKEIQFVGMQGETLEWSSSEQKIRTRSKVLKGKVVTMQAVESVPSAQRGEWGTLVIKNGSLELESRVEILKEGRVGDVVPVKGSGTSGLVMARVVGEGKLEMKL